MPLEAQLRQRISIEVKQKGLTYIAHSILTSVISCYKEYIVNVVCFNMRYWNRNILLPDKRGENSSISSHIADSTSLKTCARLAQTNLIKTSVYIH